MSHPHQVLLLTTIDGLTEADRREADEYAARAAWTLAQRWRRAVGRVRSAFRTSSGVALPAPRSADFYGG